MSTTNDIKVSYSAHVSKLVPDREYPIQTYSDFTITTGLVDKPEFVYQGDAYLIMSDLPPHQHFVRDLLGQYFIVSESFPDIAMFMVDERDKTYEKAVPSSYKNVLETDCALSPESYIKLSEYSRVYFKSVSFITNDSVPILQKNLGEYIITSPALRTNSTSLLLDSGRQLNSKLSKYKSTRLPTKKIYVSRKKEDRVVESYLDSFYEYLKFGIQGVTSNKKFIEDVDKAINDSLFNQKNAHARILDYQFRYAAQRLLIELEHEKLETFFSSLGYEILDASEYTFSDQIGIFSEATHIVGIAGGGLTNVIFCDPSTKVSVLSPTNTFYTGGHDQLLSRVVDDFYVFPEQDENPKIFHSNIKYSASELIESFSKLLVTRDLQ
jgi:hypothetical protein